MDVVGIQERADQDEVLRHLVEYEYLEGAALGIAKQVLDQGITSLSPRQRDVYRMFVEEKYFAMECERCGTELPTSEIIFALEEDGLCSWCAKMKANDD